MFSWLFVFRDVITMERVILFNWGGIIFENVGPTRRADKWLCDIYCFVLLLFASDCHYCFYVLDFYGWKLGIDHPKKRK